MPMKQLCVEVKEMIGCNRWVVSLVVGAIVLSGPLFGDAIEKLKAGNARFVSKELGHEEHAASQSPFCAVLSCSDSRVPPEIIFDQGLGDLFVVRVAGNVATPGVLESLDFASNFLHVGLLVVMGHQHCGAVEAVIDHDGEKELGTIATIIEPAVASTHSLKEAVMQNVRNQIKVLKTHPLLKDRIEEGELNVVGAYYDFDSGKVTFGL